MEKLIFFNKEKLLKIKFKKEWKKKIYLDEKEIKEEGLRKNFIFIEFILKIKRL